MVAEYDKKLGAFVAEGYFDEEFKKDIPREINSIGVVTAETGAAIQDIKNVKDLFDESYSSTFTIYPIKK